MAASSGVLLAMALCVGTAYALTCYTCDSQNSNSNCQMPSNCSANSTACKTSVFTGGIGSLSVTTISKTCSVSCTSSGFNVGIVSTQVTCCTTNLCNTSGANSVKSTYSLIIVALGLVGALLRSSSM